MTEHVESAITEEDSEWMDGASASFPKVEDLAPAGGMEGFGPGRLIAVWAQKAGKGKGKDGGSYPYVETVTLVLDDGPDGDQYNELVPAAPYRLDGFQHSTKGLEARLVKRLTAVNVKGVPLRFRPMVGRMNTQPSSFNKVVPAFSISEPTGADMVIAREHKALILAINAELEAAERKAEDREAFDS